MKKTECRQSGDTVICLNRLTSICVEKANMLYSCITDLRCPSVLMYIEADIDAVAAEIAQMLDKYCVNHSELTVKLEKSFDGKTADVSISAKSGIRLCSIGFELYTGIPGAVIKDPELDRKISLLIGNIFDRLSVLRKRGI